MGGKVIFMPPMFVLHGYSLMKHTLMGHMKMILPPMAKVERERLAKIVREERVAKMRVEKAERAKDK